MDRRSLALAACLLLLPATGGAAWRIQGSVEPDTPQDAEGGYMSLEADQVPGRGHVYFNTLAMQTGVNPNPLKGGRVAPPLAAGFQGYLGIWKDCNADGYVGHGLSGTWEYREDLLDRFDVCPRGTSHHPERWVIEFRWIGPSEQQFSPIGHHADNEAMVWGDAGVPGQAPPLRCGDPLGHLDGLLVSTGTFLQTVDCYLDFSVGETWSDRAGRLDPSLAFDDPRHPERDCDHPLNQPLSPYGNTPCHPHHPGLLDPEGEPAFVVFDCHRMEPDVRLNDPLGSYYVALLKVERMPLEIASHILHETGVQPSRSCDPNYGPVTGNLLLGYFVMRGHEGRDGTETKRAPDYNFAFMGYGSHHQPREHVVFVPEDVEKEAWDRLIEVTGESPLHWGITPLNNARSTGWRQDRGTELPPDYRGGTTRGDLQARGGMWFTFYARVGPATTSVAQVPGTIGSYGAEACQTAQHGIRNGWDCDPGAWQTPDRFVATGDAYHLRDVDCYDGSLFAGGPKASLADLSTEPPCPEVPG